jgi:8-amino-3,8-dideoxy-alpha-D-manno-octulosonate transaminase
MYLIGKEEITKIEELFLSKKLFRYQGKDVETNCTKLEKEFSSYLDVKHSLFVSSGTNALILALQAHGISTGDEVIVPSYTFVATITAVINVGARPVVASVGSGLLLDGAHLQSLITPRTKAIIAVHMDGLPCDMQQLSTFAKMNSLLLVEDVAQAVGGSVQGKKLGSWGDVSCFSFNVDKIISCGEGGMVCFNDEQRYKKALQMHDAPVSFGATHKEYLSDLSPVVGHSMRMSEISAVIMREQLKRLDDIINELKRRKSIIYEMLQPISDVLLFPKIIDGDCSTHFHLKFSDPLTTSSLSKKITSSGLNAIPLYARPAHCYWHWQHLIPAGNQVGGAERMHLSNIVRIAVDFVATDNVLSRQMGSLVNAVKT